MSRIGNNPIFVPEKAEVKIDGQHISVKGPLGELSREISSDIKVNFEDNTLTFERSSDQKEVRALHGLTRALVNNMIVGVTDGYTKELELVGVGYRATNQGQRLDLSLGYSHNIVFELLWQQN